MPDLGTSSRPSRAGAAQLVVFQRIELWLRPFAVGQSEVQFVPSAGYQAVADEVNQEKVLCVAGR